MRWPCGAHVMRVCGAVEVAAVTMIAPESRKSALPGLKICRPIGSTKVSIARGGVEPLFVPLPPASTTMTPRAVARRIASNSASNASIGPSSEAPSTVTCASRSSTLPKAICPSAAKMASTLVLPLYETASTSSTLGTMPTHPTVLSTAHSSPSTAVPCARELSSSVPWSRVAPCAFRSSWLKVQPRSRSITCWPAPSPPVKPQAYSASMPSGDGSR